MPGEGLDEADDGVRNVRLLECCDLRGRQFHVHRGKGVFEMVELCCADDRCSDNWLCQERDECQLWTPNAASGRHFRHAIDNFLFGFGFPKEPIEGPIGLGTDAGVIPVPGYSATRLGLHGMTPMPSAAQSGSISRSSSR